MDESQIPQVYKDALTYVEIKQAFDFLLVNMRESRNHMPYRQEPGPISELMEITMPKEGGIIARYRGEPNRKGWSYYETVEKVTDLKRLMMGLLRSLYFFQGKWLVLLSVFLFRKHLQTPIYELVKKLWEMLEVHLLRPYRYCPSAREIYQAFSRIERKHYRLRDTTLLGIRETAARSASLLHMIRDLAVMIIEFDDAYRYRFQNVMGEFSPELFKENP